MSYTSDSNWNSNPAPLGKALLDQQRMVAEQRMGGGLMKETPREIFDVLGEQDKGIARLTDLLVMLRERLDPVIVQTPLAVTDPRSGETCRAYGSQVANMVQNHNHRIVEVNRRIEGILALLAL